MSIRPRKHSFRSSPAATAAPAEPALPSPEIRFRIDFDERCSVGVGKIRLLESIGRSGSLSHAAREIGMSYRRAWLLIDSMNGEFDTAVVSSTVGGSGGGGAKLTRFGRELIETYRRLEARLAALTAEHMGGVAAHVVGRPGRTAARVPSRKSIARPLHRES
jgi:molybdate transport system regulatory protein